MSTSYYYFFVIKNIVFILNSEYTAETIDFKMNCFSLNFEEHFIYDLN